MIKIFKNKYIFEEFEFYCLILYNNLILYFDKFFFINFLFINITAILYYKTYNYFYYLNIITQSRLL